MHGTDHCGALQGLVLLADQLPWEALDQLPAPESLPSGPPPVWLALDEVQDPVRILAVRVRVRFYAMTKIRG